MRPTAIITGASQGIGAAIATELAKNGVHAILIARNAARLKEVADRIASAGGMCSYFPCDVTKAAEVDATLQAIGQEVTDAPAILINNAGFGGPFHATNSVSEEEWDAIFATNVKAAFLFCRRLLPGMKKNNFGRIINIASIYGLAGGALSSTYAASKHALIGYTKSLAIEWADCNITCNVISPGYIDTAMGASPVKRQHIIDSIPCKRQGQPAEIARLVVFLIQPESGYINGANLVIDGGLSAGFHFSAMD